MEGRYLVKFPDGLKIKKDGQEINLFRSGYHGTAIIEMTNFDFITKVQILDTGVYNQPYLKFVKTMRNNPEGLN